MTIQAWLKHAQGKLKDASITSARLDCLVMLECELKKPREWLLAHTETMLTSEQRANLSKKTALRADHTPLAYIIGAKEFYGRTFCVTTDVLIPRPETEALINLLTQFLTNKDHPCNRDDPCIIVDIGTGSGVLAITTQLELPNTTVVATDVSEAAISVANKNATALGAKIQLYQVNLLDLPRVIKPDIILANLPYVPDQLITSEEITKEPKLALFSGIDGLDHYRLFWAQLSDFMPKPTIVIAECLTGQHDEIEKLAKIAGYTLKQTDTLAQLFILETE